MSLSNFCFHAADALTNRYHFFLKENYSAESMGKLAAIILELTELAYELSTDAGLSVCSNPNIGAPATTKTIAQCAVVHDLIVEPETRIVYNEAVERFALMAAVNMNVRAAIVEAFNWQTSAAGQSQAQFGKADVIAVEELFRRIHTDSPV
jgi:hypothetical protein